MFVMCADLIGSHWIIQLKLLCLAAYEGFVLNTNTADIEQQPLLGFIKEVNVKYVKENPMMSCHTSNKEVMQQNT